MEQDIPQWAIQKACNIRDEGYLRGELSITFVFARYIAEHEEPPVDPLLIEARKLFSEFHRNGGCWLTLDSGVIAKEGAAEKDILAGKFDYISTLKLQLAALRRGMELAREQTP